MSIVYIVQDSPGKNFLPAKKFGTLRVLLTPHEACGSIYSVISVLNKKLCNVTKDDYLLLVGDPVLIGLVSAIALDVTDGYISFLRWNRSMYEYKPEHVEELWTR